MNDLLRKKAVVRKASYIGVILALFVVSMFWRGKFQLPVGNPNTVTTRDANGNLTPLSTADRIARMPIAYQAEDLELRERDAGDPEVAGALAQVSLVGVRGFIVTGLWNATITSQKRGEYHEMERTAMLLTKLQPHFITPWVFQAWNISYNVSVETDKLGDQYYYIARGISLLSEGDRANTRSHRRGNAVYMVGSPDIRYQLGFYCQNKFTVSDKVATLYSLSQLSMIPGNERDPERFRPTPNDPVNPERFREFCDRNPQLVRRLKTKLGMRSPEDVVNFLATNWRIPARYDVVKKEPAQGDRAFPVLPVADEGTDPQLVKDLDALRAQEADKTAKGPDAIDIRMVARAWFEHALAVCPPPKDGVPSMTPQKDEYDRFRYRIPERPALIVVRFAPARAQNYVAERLQKEGWFDDKSMWNPDAGYDRDARWFPPYGRPEPLTTQLNTLELPADDASALLRSASNLEPKLIVTFLEQKLNETFWFVPDREIKPTDDPNHDVRSFKAVRRDPKARDVPPVGVPKPVTVQVQWAPLKPDALLGPPPSDPSGENALHEEVGHDERGPDGKRVRAGNQVWLKRMRVRSGTNALAEWEKAFALWREAGRKNGLNPENRLRQEELALTASRAGAAPDREYTDAQLAAMKPPLTREHLGAMRAVQYYDQNRQITQYQKFLDESLAEMELELAAAKKLLWHSDELHDHDPDGTLELAARIRAVSLWRKVFTSDKHMAFYDDTRSDTLHESSLEQELKIADLLVKSGDPVTAAKVKAARAGLTVLAPAVQAVSEQQFARAIAVDEAQARLSLAFAMANPKSDLQVRAIDEVRKFNERYPDSPTKPTVEGTARGLLDGEFAWMKEFSVRSQSEWVRHSVRVERLMKDGVLSQPAPPPVIGPDGPAKLPPPTPTR